MECSFVCRKKKSYFIKILKTLEQERTSGITIYPSKKDVFNAFRLTEFNNIKIVILGQDPYHNPNQAHGLAFSILPGVAIPPSLMNIFKELKRSVPNFVHPVINTGQLDSWAHQGVFLLNSILTVRRGQAYSHANLGWKIFTDKTISLINEYLEGVVFLLWGAHAQKASNIIDQQRHYVLKTSHPSPRSVHYGFYGCNHFVLANQYLEKRGKKPINWLSILDRITY